MFHRTIHALLCLAIVATLTNGLLLAMQTYAWVTMVSDRAPELGLERAIISTVEGQDLCEVCLVVRSESEKQRKNGSDQFVDLMVKVLNFAGEEDESSHLCPPNSSFADSRSVDQSVPDGLVGETQGPPPREKA